MSKSTTKNTISNLQPQIRYVLFDISSLTSDYGKILKKHFLNQDFVTFYIPKLFFLNV